MAIMFVTLSKLEDLGHKNSYIRREKAILFPL